MFKKILKNKVLLIIISLFLITICLVLIHKCLIPWIRFMNLQRPDVEFGEIQKINITYYNGYTYSKSDNKPIPNAIEIDATEELKQFIKDLEDFEFVDYTYGHNNNDFHLKDINDYSAYNYKVEIDNKNKFTFRYLDINSIQDKYSFVVWNNGQIDFITKIPSSLILSIVLFVNNFSK